MSEIKALTDKIDQMVLGFNDLKVALAKKNATLESDIGYNKSATKTVGEKMDNLKNKVSELDRDKATWEGIEKVENKVSKLENKMDRKFDDLRMTIFKVAGLISFLITVLTLFLKYGPDGL